MAILQFRRGGSLVESLLPSEMFFDETINTFKIGTDGSGAYIIVTKLNESNVGSLSLTGNISASNAYFTGNVDLDGDIFIGGNITLGADGNDTIFVGAPLSGSLIPLSGSQYDLGSIAKPWNDVYVDNIIATTISGSITFSYTDLIDKPALVSGSSQINHDTTSNYVLNEHINHLNVSILAGNGLSGGGNIISSRTLTLDTGSIHFTSGVKTKLNTENVISSSAQLYTEFDSRYLNTAGDDIVSGSSQISYPLISDIPANIVSGSSQINADSITNFDANVLTYINSQSVLSGSGYLKNTTIENVSLLASNWTLVGGFYEYDYAHVAISVDSVIEIIPYNSTIEVVKEAEIMPMVISGIGTVKIYAKYLPTADILIALNIQK